MALAFPVVNGAEFAESASAILERAWQPPALHYSPEYVRWQLSFPGSADVPAVAAYDGGRPVGFAAATRRRVRHSDMNFEAAVVSFVAVDPGCRGRGVAAGLYRVLLRVLSEHEIPVVTYAVPESSGQRAIFRAYPEAGFRIWPMGTYCNFAYLGRKQVADNGWTAAFSDDGGTLAELAAVCAARNASLLWSSPDPDQLRHYGTDPRPRRTVVATSSTGQQMAGLSVRSEIRSPLGRECLTTLDCVWAPEPDTNGLLALLELLSREGRSAGVNQVVSCPNLAGFKESTLLSARIRRTGGVFHGYFCSPLPRPEPAFHMTNLEIV